MSSFAGLLWAPQAPLASRKAGEVYGALTVGTMSGNWSGMVAIHGDRALRELGDECP